jgi:hypothetical protein
VFISALKPIFSDRKYHRYAVLLLFAGMAGSVGSGSCGSVRWPAARAPSAGSGSAGAPPVQRFRLLSSRTTRHLSRNRRRVDVGPTQAGTTPGILFRALVLGDGANAELEVAL